MKNKITILSVLFVFTFASAQDKVNKGYIESYAVELQGNQSFTGIKSSTNTGASNVNGIALVNASSGTSTQSLSIESSGAGIGVRVTLTGTGSALFGRNQTNSGSAGRFDSPTGSTGNLFEFTKNNTITSFFNHNGILSTPPPIITTSPTTSAGTYEFLTRNTTGGGVEKIASANVATSASVSLKANIASPTFTTGITTPAINLSGQTASTIAVLDASNNIISASTAIYPNLTEFGYGKGVTSPIQTQIDSKASNLLTGYTSGAGTISGSDSVKSAIEKLNGNQQSSKKSFIYNFDGIQLTNAGGTYFMKALTGLTYSDDKGTADYTVLKTLGWYRCAFITPYKCRLKKALFGTNGIVDIYVGGIDNPTSTKSDIYHASNVTTSVFVNNDTNVVIEEGTRIYLAFKTATTGVGVMEGTLYFEEF